MENHVLYFVKPHEVHVTEQALPQPTANEVLIKNVISGISAGTEMLMFRGLMPQNMLLDSNFPHLQHSAHYPFKYGYASVGKIIAAGNSDLDKYIDRWVFAFNPHESYFCAKEDNFILLPQDLNPKDALFIPHMETAINFILDAVPQIGENVMILGLGIIGILTTALMQQFPISVLSVMDQHEKRRKIGYDLGAKQIFDIQDASDIQDQYDLVFELSGNPDALNTAIQLTGFEGRILLGSWYGTKPGTINLGGKFHRDRIQLISSQVSTVASKLQGRWNKQRRLNVALEMIKKIQPSRFITHKFDIKNAIDAYQLLDSGMDEVLQVIFTYGEENV